MLARINNHYAVTLPVTALFRHPTAQKLARVVEAELSATAPGEDDLAAQIAQMSDEEVARLLLEQSRDSE